MAFRKALYRSELKNAGKMTAILKKIKDTFVKKKTCVVISKHPSKYEGAELVSLTIDETLSVGTIVFNDGLGVQTYDKADIAAIRRIRSRKWEIVLKQSANPA